jgi:hypothetical protein
MELINRIRPLQFPRQNHPENSCERRRSGDLLAVLRTISFGKGVDVMRKLNLQMQTSVDGYVRRSGDGPGWQV